MKRNTFMILVAATLLGHCQGLAQQVYWVESTFGMPALRRANIDGTERMSISLAPGVLPQAIAIDRSRGQLYWTSRKLRGAHIYRASTGLSGIDTIAMSGSACRGIALDPVGGRLYWTSTNLREGSRIHRANVNGSEDTTLCIFPAGGRESPRGIVADIPNSKLYWADFGLGTIRRANLDGSGEEDLVTGLQGPVGVALDSTSERIYWSEAIGGTIKRSNLDGLSPVTLISGIPGVQYIALDVRNGTLCWTEYGPGGVGRIMKSTLDGNNPATIVGALPSDSVLNPLGVAILDTVRMTGVVESRVPLAFVLDQNFPNPFNPSTTIRYGVPQRSRVLLHVYNPLGEHIVQLVAGEVDAGYHEVRFDASHLPSGVFFCRLLANGHVATMKLLLVR